MKPLKIIIFEDEFLLANDLKRQIQDYNYVVSAIFRKAEDGLQFLKEHNTPEEMPDVVLMDISLAGKMSGIEAARIIMSEYRSAVVFLSGMSQVDLMDEAFSQNPHPFLLKPFDVHQALVSIRLAIYQKSLEHCLQQYETRYGVLNAC